MEPVLKRAKLTGHFRVALKPQDVNVQKGKGDKLKRQHDFGKENKIELITIDDDDDVDDQNFQVGAEDLRKQRDTIKQDRQPEKPLATRQQDESIKQHLPITTTHTINRYHSPPGLRQSLDHDRTSIEDVLYEPHYALDSFNYDREREVKFRTSKYLDDLNHKEQQFTAVTRARFVTWIVRMRYKFRLWHDSIYMAVKLADLYLMKKAVPRKHHQLLYLTALWISSKYEERVPYVDIDCYIQEVPQYTRRDIIRFEVDILRTLKFELRFPLSFGFLRRYVHATGCNIETLHLSRYILESSLLDYEMIETLESKIAAASLYLAFRMLRLDDDEVVWSEAAEYYTSYKEEDLIPLLPKLKGLITRNTYIRRKYSSESFMAVSVRIPPLK